MPHVHVHITMYIHVYIYIYIYGERKVCSTFGVDESFFDKILGMSINLLNQ